MEINLKHRCPLERIACVHHHNHIHNLEPRTSSKEEGECPLCNSYPNPSSIESKQQREREQNKTPDFVQHFLWNCDYVNKNIRKELKNLESQETEIILRLDEIDIRKICVIGNFLAKNLHESMW